MFTSDLLPRSLLWAGLWGVGALTASPLAYAQLIPDNTLGDEASQINPDGMVDGLPTDLVEGGAIRGENLFHSFREFNVDELQSLYFANPIGIENILSRVTGDNISNILGTLGVDGGANLFLLNPNGIIFGPNAQLDIAGSFFVSTADAFDFGNGDIYSAINPELPPLLEIDITPGLQFSAAQREIESTGKLTVGADLTLAAGNLTLTGELIAGENLTLQAQDTVTMRDSATVPLIAAAGNELAVQGNQSVDIFALTHPDSGLYSGGDMVLRSLTPVIGDTRYYSYGGFEIEDLDEELGYLSSPNDPVIRANGDVFLAGYQGASLHILAGGSVTVRDFVWIQAADPVNGLVDDTLQLRNGDTINGQLTPTLDIRAGIDWVTLPGNEVVAEPGDFRFPPDFAELDPTPSANIQVGTIFFADAASDPTLAPGQGVYVPIRGVISLTNQYRPNNAPVSEANIEVNTVQTLPLLANRSIINGDTDSGGYIEIQSRGNISIEGIVNVDPPAPLGNFELLGNGGDIVLSAAGNVTLRPGALINSLGLEGGNITVESGGTFSAAGPAINTNNIAGILSSSISTDPAAKGGTVNIVAETVALSNGAFIFTDTGIDANRIPLPGVFAEGGDILISTQDLQLRDGSEISASTFSGGETGRIWVQPLRDRTTASVALDGFAPIEFNPDGSYANGGFSSGLFSNLEDTSTGDGQFISIETGTLNISNGAVISSRNRGSGNAGVIAIDVDNLIMRSGGQVLATTFGSGDAGSMLVDAANTIDISGTDSTYETRRNQIYFSVRQSLINDGQFPAEANANAFEFARSRVDPINSASGLQASDALDYFANTNPDGSINFLPDINGLGRPGNIFVEAPRVILQDSAEINTSNFGREGGNYDETFGGIQEATESGIIAIDTNQLFLLGGGRVISQTYGTGAGSFILVQPLNDAPSEVNIAGTAPITTGASGQPLGGFSSGLFTSTENSDIFLLEDPNYPLELLPSVTGAGGDIFIIDIDAVKIREGGVLNSRSRSDGEAGDIYVLGADAIDLINGGQIVTAAYRTGGAGSIFLESTGPVTVRGINKGFQQRVDTLDASYATYLENLFTNFYGLDPISAQTRATGVSPITGIQEEIDRAFLATQFLTGPVSSVSGLQAQSGFESIGDGTTEIFVRGGSLTLDDLAEISTTTFGRANAGTIDINVAGALAAANTSSIRTEVQVGASGDGGDITVQANSLELLGGSQILSGVFRGSRTADGGLGDGGNIIVNATESIRLSGFTQQTDSNGQAVLVSSGFLAQTEQFAKGEAGNINVNTRNLEIENLATISTLTRNERDAGDIKIGIRDPSLGLRSDIVLETLTLSNGGNITVSGPVDDTVNDPGAPGNIAVDANLIQLFNGGRIRGVTTSGEQGNITLTARDRITLRGSQTSIDPSTSCPTCSEISTEAFGEEATGGNITLRVGFGVIAELGENSDIVANAPGSNKAASITVERIGNNPFYVGISGFTDQQGRTLLSDLDASSELTVEDGSVTVDDGEDVTAEEVPTAAPDPADLIDRRCDLIASGGQSEFSVTGRGGLPADPAALLEESAFLEDLGPEPLADGGPGSAAVEGETLETPSEDLTDELIQEPQNWFIAPDGTVHLYAETSSPQLPHSQAGQACRT